MLKQAAFNAEKSDLTFVEVFEGAQPCHHPETVLAEGVVQIVVAFVEVVGVSENYFGDQEPVIGRVYDCEHVIFLCGRWFVDHNEVALVELETAFFFDWRSAVELEGEEFLELGPMGELELCVAFERIF